MSEAKIASLKAMLDSKDIMLDSKDTLIEDLQTAKMKLEQKNADFVERLRAGEKLRRKLHGQMQDMKVSLTEKQPKIVIFFFFYHVMSFVHGELVFRFFRRFGIFQYVS